MTNEERHITLTSPSHNVFEDDYCKIPHSDATIIVRKNRHNSLGGKFAFTDNGNMVEVDRKSSFGL